MNFLPMQYYLEVVKEKSISRAAARLHITQQTLSAHIAALEKELGCTLFRRKPDFALTYAGRVFCEYARRFDSLYRSMRQEFDDISGNEAGELSVGVAPTRGRFLLPPILSAYRKLRPNIRIRLVETTNSELISRLLDGGIDLIFASVSEDHPLIASKKIFEEEMCLLIPESLLSAKDRRRIKNGDYAQLAACPFLMMNRQEDISGVIGNAFFDRHGIVPKIAVASGNMETILDLCLAGEGACFCSKELAAKIFGGRDDSHLLQIPLGESFSIRAAWLKKPYIRKALLDFVKVCETTAP